MPGDLQPELLASRIRDLQSDMDPIEDYARALSRSPSGKETIGQLLVWQDALVRFWALQVAPRVLDHHDYVDALRKAATDPDEEVRNEAIDRLIELDPKWAIGLSKKLLTKLGRDALNDVFTLWSIARLRDTTAVARVRAYAAAPATWPAHKKIAEVIAGYLENGPEWALSQIENHSDHDHMEAFATLAWHVLHTDGARKALAVASRQSPDVECRDICLHALKRFDNG